MIYTPIFFLSPGYYCILQKIVGKIGYLLGTADGPDGEEPGTGDGIYVVEPTSYTPWLAQSPDWARN